MAKNKTFDPKLPVGFHYSVKNNEMIVHFFCDCCNNEVKVSKRLKDKIDALEKNYQDVFNELKKELDDKFFRCENCNLLICEECWDNRETKCKNCPICFVE